MHALNKSPLARFSRHPHGQLLWPVREGMCSTAPFGGSSESQPRTSCMTCLSVDAERKVPQDGPDGALTGGETGWGWEQKQS